MNQAGLEGHQGIPQGSVDNRHNRPAVRRYVATCALLALPVLAIGGALTGTLAGGITAFLAFCLMSGLAGLTLRANYPYDRLGIANVVTLGRTAMIATLFAPLAQPGLLAQAPALAWIVLAIAIVALCLDGVDGYAARRQGLSSDFGARFDMEIDSLFALLLAVLALQSGKADVWVLLLGGMRYAFWGASLLLVWLQAPLPERFSRKAICVVQIAILIGLLAPIITGPISWTLAALGTVLLTYSFGRDVLWLSRHRR